MIVLILSSFDNTSLPVLLSFVGMTPKYLSSRMFLINFPYFILIINCFLSHPTSHIMCFICIHFQSPNTEFFLITYRPNSLPEQPDGWQIIESQSFLDFFLLFPQSFQYIHYVFLIFRFSYSLRYNPDGWYLACYVDRLATNYSTQSFLTFQVGHSV